MRIAFVVTLPELADYDDTTGLLGDALVRRAHEVTIAAGERPRWYPGGRLVEWAETIRHADFDRVVNVAKQHLQWTAGGIAGASHAEPAGEAAGTPLVVDDVYRDKPGRECDPLRVLLLGAAEAVARGVEDGYGAVAHARWFHQRLHLVRASPWAPSRSEPLDDVQEFHVGLDDAEMIRLLHSVDVVLVPAHAEAGFSLIAAQAMAASIPTVMTATPAHTAMAAAPEAYAPEHNAVELGERLVEVLQDDELRDRLRAQGRETAKRWRADDVATEFEALLTK